MEHGLSASSHLLSLLPPIKFWYIWSDISGIMGGWLRKVKIIKRNAQKSKISKSLDVKEIPISSFLWGHVVIWKRKSNPLFSLLSAALALTHFLSLLLPPLNRAPHTVQSKGQYVFVFRYTYKWPYEKNAVLLGNWESFWLQFVELRPMNNPSTLLGWKDRVRTFELDKVSLSWLGACWAVLSIAESARRWEFMVPPSSAEELCAVRVQLFGAESATELRVQGLNWKETEH